MSKLVGGRAQQLANTKTYLSHRSSRQTLRTYGAVDTLSLRAGGGYAPLPLFLR
ncbi:hypothetical protein [Candidatus Hakubella thermalkaliphila]|uniref:hypothetical protein n=1 Tax=Candidatus Hakubella thermalkaliphila TaxID=2754717 RepID=UPI001594D398|nr:hypothetical protein [Candidatus Hakubella thermalkaliphila]